MVSARGDGEKREENKERSERFRKKGKRERDRWS